MAGKRQDGWTYEVPAAAQTQGGDGWTYEAPKPPTPPNQIDPGAEGAHQLVLGFNRGLNSLVALPGEIASAVTRYAGFPETAEKLRWNNELSRRVTRPDIQPQTTIGRYANSMGQAVGASAAPTMGIIARAPAMAAVAPTTTTRAIVQDIGRRIGQSTPASVMALDTTAALSGGFGSEFGADVAKGLGAGETGQNIGRVVGGIGGAMLPGIAVSTADPARKLLARTRQMQGQRGAYGNVAESLDRPPGTTRAEAVNRLRNSIALGDETGGMQGVQRQRMMEFLGQEMARNGGDARAARTAAVTRFAQEYGVTPQEAQSHMRRLERIHSRNPLMLGEQPSVSSADDALRQPSGNLRPAGQVDMERLQRPDMSGTREKFDYLASSGNGPSAVQTRQALAVRQQRLSHFMRDMLGRIQQGSDTQGRRLSIEDVSALIDNAQRQASRAYEAAYQGPINNAPAVHVLPRVLQRFENQALGRAGEVREAMERGLREFYIDTPNGRVAMMSLRQLQDARTRIREMMDGYMSGPEAKPSLARPLRHLYQQVTAVMERMSPQWAQANRQWADMSLDRTAQRLAEGFAKTPGPRFRQQVQEFQQLNPAAQNVVRVYYAQKLLDDIDRAKDTHSLGKLFTSDHHRGAIRTLFGDRAVVDFTRAVRDVDVGERTFRMNSRTHVRGEVRDQEELYQSMDGARRNWSIQGIKDAMAERLQQFLVEWRNKHMADIVTTPMENVPRVAMHLDRMQNQAAVLDRISRPSAQPSLGAGRVSPAIQGSIPDDEN